MKQIINFHIAKGEKYVASGVELPVVTQALTLDEFVKNIKEATELHIEGEDTNALGLSSSPAVQASFEIGELQYA